MPRETTRKIRGVRSMRLGNVCPARATFARVSAADAAVGAPLDELAVTATVFRLVVQAVSRQVVVLDRRAPLFRVPLVRSAAFFVNARIGHAQRLTVVDFDIRRAARCGSFARVLAARLAV